jgi:hypothetical protein
MRAVTGVEVVYLETSEVGREVSVAPRSLADVIRKAARRCSLVRDRRLHLPTISSRARLAAWFHKFWQRTAMASLS